MRLVERPWDAALAVVLMLAGLPLYAWQRRSQGLDAHVRARGDREVAVREVLPGPR